MCLPGHYLCWAGNKERHILGASLTLQEQFVYVYMRCMGLVSGHYCACRPSAGIGLLHKVCEIFLNFALTFGDFEYAPSDQMEIFKMAKKALADVLSNIFYQHLGLRLWIKKLQ